MQKHAVNALMAAVILTMPLYAQMGRGPGGSMSRSVTSFGGRANSHNAYPRAVYFGSPFWLNDFPSSYTQTPSVIVLQPASSPAATAAKPMEEPKPQAPLMIEWQGDRYVRRTDLTNETRNPQPDYIAETKSGSTDKHPAKALPTPRSSPPPQIPPATFVFRDGHREQSSDYSIIAGVIYARGDYWTSGSWSKQIPVAQLDLPATFKANEERGVTFRLPSAPNEVVTRP